MTDPRRLGETDAEYIDRVASNEAHRAAPRSRRDMFAAAALTGLLAREGDTSKVVDVAVEVADEMLRVLDGTTAEAPARPVTIRVDPDVLETYKKQQEEQQK
jgi:uncharacterized protein (DUF4415 family)